ncbi:hypothetical protein ACK25U_19630 [Ectopseudomonas mendocina]
MEAHIALLVLAEALRPQPKAVIDPLLALRDTEPTANFFGFTYEYTLNLDLLHRPLRPYQLLIMPLD